MRRPYYKRDSLFFHDRLFSAKTPTQKSNLHLKFIIAFSPINSKSGEVQSRLVQATGDAFHSFFFLSIYFRFELTRFFLYQQIWWKGLNMLRHISNFKMSFNYSPHLSFSSSFALGPSWNHENVFFMPGTH